MMDLYKIAIYNLPVAKGLNNIPTNLTTLYQIINVRL